MKSVRKLAAAITTSSIIASPAAESASREAPELGGLEFEELMQIKVTSVSKRQEQLSTAPAPVTMMARDESLQRANQQLEERGRQLQHELAERRRAQEALAQSEEKWRSLVENAPDFIITVDPSGTILFINRVLPGYDFDRVVGSSVYAYMPAESHGKVRAALEQVFATGETARYEIAAAGAPHETAWYASRVGPIKSGGRVVAATIFASDITQQKQLEEHFRQALKMEAVGRLAGGIAHDFNNLLLAILGFSDILLSELEPNSLHRESVSEIQKAAERAASLTRQLLAYSRKQVLQVRVLDVNEVVNEVDRLLRRMIGSDIQLLTQLNTPLGPIKGDPGQLTQVLINLAINARDAMPKGGKLTIQTEDIELNGSGHELELPPGRYVLLKVTDTGQGMSAEVKGHLFEPFFTTKEIGKGTGLGLSTAYGIIKQSGGDVQVESDLGHGTTFRIYLPCVDQPEQSLEPIQSARQIAAARATILLVEDEVGVRNLLRRVLHSHGYNVLEAQNGREALKICLENRPPIDLVVTDLVMPQMTGQELAERIRHLRPTLKLLYISGFTDDAVARQNLEEKGAAFLQKPFGPDILLETVRQLLDNSRPAPLQHS